MDGWTIARFLSLDPYTSKWFKGYGMQDSFELPFANSKKALYILNTDKSNGPGEHWCAVLFNNSHGEFFDPFGMPPTLYGFRKLLNSKDVSKIVYNSTPVQHLFSNACGYHCLFYSYHKCRGYSLDEIIQMYDITDTEKNDQMVVEFVTEFGKIYKI